LSGTDKDFHGCNKPHFSEKGVIVYAGKHLDTGDGGIFSFPRDPIAGAEKDIRFRTLPTFADVRLLFPSHSRKADIIQAVPPTVELQKQHTKVLVQEHAPLANLRIELDALEFKSMSDSVALGTPASAHEQQAWKLLSLLYDDNIPEGVTSDEFANNRDRCLKEQLSDFWRALVFEDAQKHAQDSITPEEKAIAYLSCNSVADACQVLVEGRDFRLATMISQIGGDDTTRQDMMSQIDEWRRMDVLSEMDESARTLYELIAGNCARSEGKTGGGRENKAQSFGISSRFNLDWRRAFGLRLWYGTKIDEPIELAVAQFADALRFGNEDVKPVPWFIEQGKDMGWTDPEKTREDLLWGILKLYASAKMEIHANVEDVLAPENVSGHPLNARMSFQLFNLFKSRAQDQTELAERIVGMPVIREKENHQSSFLSTASTTDRDDGTIDPLVELGDKLALTYAASLHTPEHWTTAAWVYAHLSHAATRAHYIRSLLAQFSYSFSLTHSDATFQYLSNDLSIPQTWIHAAAALQAKTEGDALRQAMHLIKANELKEAHEVLCRTVGPESIISRDYDPLRELLGGFMPTPPSSPTQESFTRRRAKEPVQGWSQGGQIYFDYIELLDLTGQRSAYRVDEDLNERIAQLLTKLSRALELVRITWERVEIEERVALREIAGTVADGIAKIKVCCAMSMFVGEFETNKYAAV
jgi:nuclear pore complex protein Nup98-Nup96